MSVCRVSLVTATDDGAATRDAALCAHTVVASLLPHVVEATGHADTASGPRWRLDRDDGTPLDEALSLSDNMIHDGDVLFLRPEHEPPRALVHTDPAHVLAGAANAADRDLDRLVGPIRIGTVVIAAVMLAWSGIHAGGVGPPVIAALGTTTVCASAWARRSPALAAAGALLVAVTAILVVPSDLGAPHVLLAATAALALSVVMAHLLGGPPIALTATATAAGLVAIAVAPAVVAALPTATVGVLLAMAALVLLAASPRLAVTIAGLDGAAAAGGDTLATRSTTAHAVLSGLLFGSVSSAAAGAVLVAAGRGDVPQAAEIGFIAATSLVVTLRARVHADADRRIALLFGGMACTATAVTAVSRTTPTAACWLAAASLVVALGARRAGPRPPVVTRAIELLDYAASASVVPLACWVLGVYALARDWQLT